MRRVPNSRRTFRRKPPTWFDEDTSACECSEAGRETTTVREHVGYSDFYYAKVRCETCGHEWCFHIEG